MVKVPIPPKNLGEIVDAFEKGITPKTKVILMSHVINITGQITPVKAVCELAKSKGIEVIVDGAHSFGHFAFTQKDLGCDYYGTSLHKWLYAPKGTGFEPDLYAYPEVSGDDKHVIERELAKFDDQASKALAFAISGLRVSRDACPQAADHDRLWIQNATPGRVTTMPALPFDTGPTRCEHPLIQPK